MSTNQLSSRFIKSLQDFIQSNKEFSIIYSTTTNFISSNIDRICVLDSSFNPPHKGHYALIEESLKFNNHSKNKSILLLLSIKNADKLYKPESFDKRLEMMYLMAENLKIKYNNHVNISIGLTNHAKFVDKSLSVLNYITSNHKDFNNNLKITFLIGFDTLIRIFNPKYYLPDKLSNKLENFMKTTDLFCLTRFDENITTNDQQSEYVNDIKSGKNEEIPSHWSDNIHLIKNENFANISSSRD
ncbi:unnamed protein product [Candida verbasci]|uniref:Cytidyltransferase-like domain-containing protein n=1 Tax=Candida verbasci TaxID=1227364 RepID=A0A9W4XCD0_9ASCO|nr:unnamed protein product [Candida verbasci]